MQHKIGIEEHFAIPETMVKPKSSFIRGDAGNPVNDRLLDMMDHRLIEMDDNGIDIMILSLNSPGIQRICNPEDAAATARLANDHLAETIEKKKNRFRGFAALPMQDPDAAITEMRRAIFELGLVGVLVNGYSQIDSLENDVYLDDPRYKPFWAELEKNGVPFYLHPRDPMPRNAKLMENHPWLGGAAWAFTVEIATHVIRLMTGGLFDDYPGLKMLLGHLGEGLPFLVWRSDNMLSKSRRIRMPAKRKLADYLNENIWVTTSGQFHYPPLLCTMLQMGADRILFSTDYPFEEVCDASNWFDNCQISESDKRKIGRQNAIDLFGLKL